MASYPQVRFELAITTWDANGRRNATPITAITYPVAGAAALTGVEDRTVPIAASATGVLYFGATGGDLSELIAPPWTFMCLLPSIVLDFEFDATWSGANSRASQISCAAGGFLLLTANRAYNNWTYTKGAATVTLGSVFGTGTLDIAEGFSKIYYKEPNGTTGNVRMIYGK